MSFEHRNLTWTLIQLFLAGVFCSKWRVEYQEQHICAVKGSSVVLHCSFYHYDNMRVRRVIWGHVKSPHLRGRVIFDSSLRKVSTKFQYIGDKHQSCSLKIHEVTKNDAGKYIITFNSFKMHRWHGNVGTTLKVVDQRVFVTKPNRNAAVKEGDSVNLTCINKCGLDLSSAYNWFKNGEYINDGHVLYLSNISSANSGNYTCSLKTQAGMTSEVINVNVEYAPKNTVVSVRPLTEVNRNSNLTLICSSHSNPPVENYTWFKIDDDIVEVGHQPVFFPGDRGQYICRVTNKHGSQNSSAVSLNMKSYSAAFTRDVCSLATVVTVALLLIATIVIAVRRVNKTWAPNTDYEKDTQNIDNVNWLICDNSQSKEEQNKSEEPVYATLHFRDTRKSNTGQQRDNDEDVIYSTVCQ